MSDTLRKALELVARYFRDDPAIWPVIANPTKPHDDPTNTVGAVIDAALAEPEWQDISTAPGGTPDWRPLSSPPEEPR